VPTVGNNDLFPDYNMTVAAGDGANDQLLELYGVWAPAGWLPPGSFRSLTRGGYFNTTAPRAPRLPVFPLFASRKILGCYTYHVCNTTYI